MPRPSHGPLSTLDKWHGYCLHTSSRLTSYFRKHHEPGATDVTPARVVRILYELGIKCVLMGTHALNTWRSEPRATQDVDVLVRKREIGTATQAIRRKYPKLAIDDAVNHVRLMGPVTEKGVVDLLKLPPAVSRVVFRNAIPVGPTHRIPDLETTLVSKFATLVSRDREASKRMLDCGDFMDLVMANRAELDTSKLERLADLVHPGGAKRVLELIEATDSGRTIRL